MKPLVIIPTFNEVGNIRPIVDQLEGIAIPIDCLFVDDGSPDGTGDAVLQEAQRRPWIHLLQRGAKLGIGSAHLDGLRWARSRGYERVVTMDCDLTHSPRDIPAMLLEAEKGADVVVGSRYLQRGSLAGWDWKRKIITRTAHLLTRIFLGIPYDCTGAFRIYKLNEHAERILQLVRTANYTFFFESLFLFAANGARIVQVPICLPPRTYGSSKMPADEPFRGLRFLISVAVDRLLRPELFRIQGHQVVSDPNVKDSQSWDAYWTRAGQSQNRVYQAIATLYRRGLITHRLTRVIRSTFRRGARVLHAGCGSGHVDQFNQDFVKITAVDTSLRALDTYSRCVPRSERVCHASIFHLPFADGTFDGIYHLGVVEHFERAEIVAILCELRRVMKPDAKMVIFWPHASATSVAVLKLWHRLSGKDAAPLHPPEVSLAQGREWVRGILESAGFSMQSYHFGAVDFWVQAVIVAAPKDSASLS